MKKTVKFIWAWIEISFAFALLPFFLIYVVFIDLAKEVAIDFKVKRYIRKNIK